MVFTDYIEKLLIALKCTVQNSKKCYILYTENFKLFYYQRPQGLFFFIYPMSRYNNRRWKSKRKYILKRDHYLDQELIRFGKRVEANTVHHIFPVEFYPELQFVDWNLISLSETTHNTLHDRHKNEHFNLTAKGLELQQRHKRQYQRWCKKHGYKPHYQN